MGAESTGEEREGFGRRGTSLKKLEGRGSCLKGALVGQGPCVKERLWRPRPRLWWFWSPCLTTGGGGPQCPVGGARGKTDTNSWYRHGNGIERCVVDYSYVIDHCMHTGW